MKRLVSLLIVVLLFSVAHAASIRDKFKAEVDEFTDSTTYYPARFSSYQDFLHSYAGHELEPVVWSTKDYCGFNFIIGLVSDDWIFATDIYVVTDDNKYTIPYAFKDIKTDVFESGRCYESYDLTPFNLSFDMQKSIFNTKTIKMRVGGSRVLSIQDWQLQDMKDALLLYWYLSLER
jgi:hypothetical protein